MVRRSAAALMHGPSLRLYCIASTSVTNGRRTGLPGLNVIPQPPPAAVVLGPGPGDHRHDLGVSPGGVAHGQGQQSTVG